MLSILLYALLVIVALLAVPFWISVSAEREQTPVVRVRWLFGLVRLRISSGTGSPPRRAPKPSRRPARSRYGFGSAWAFIRSEGVTARLRRLLRQLVATTHPRVDRLHIELGLDDPADTGELWAFLGPLSGWLFARYRGLVRLEPCFSAPMFAVEGQARFTLVPLELLGVGLQLALSPPLLRGLVAARRAAR